MSSKNELYSVVDNIEGELFELNSLIFNNPEIGNEEVKASAAIKCILKKYGFSIEENLCGLKTAFRAKYSIKENGPKIGLLCEYDALKGIGHACGHNLQGPAIVGAAVALKEVVKDIPCEIIVYGTPAEETDSGKLVMVRENVFDELDVALMMHAGDRTSYFDKTLALNLIDFIFKGKSSHAAIAPEKGRSALDAVIQMFNGMEYLREHVDSDTRIHGIIKEGGVAANIVPERAVAQFYVRSPERKNLNGILNRVYKIAEGAAMMTETEVEIKEVKACDNMHSIQSLNDLLVMNAEALKLENILPPKKEVGSTDFSNVTQRVPGACLRIGIAPENTPVHTIEFLKAAGSGNGQKAIIYSAKILAATVFDLLNDEKFFTQIKSEYKEKL